MKKRVSRLIAMMAALAIMLSMVSVNAFASSTVNVNQATLTAGQWTTLSPYTYSSGTTYYYWYKISVPYDGKLTLSVNGSDPRVRLYNYNKSYCIDAIYDAGTTYYALSAGTYYVSSFNYSTTDKVKYTYTKGTNAANYCLAKATALNKNTYVGVCQTPKYNYDRWYKVTLTSAQYLRIVSKRYVGEYSYVNDEYDILVYDSHGVRVDISDMSYGAISESKLSKGTYYIRLVSFGSFADRYLGYYCNLKWY